MSESTARPRYQLAAPNLSLARYDATDGVKRFELVAQEHTQSLVNGVWIKAWGYNGSTPGPIIVVHEHERIQIVVVNRLLEATSVHWHGLVVPNQVGGVPIIGAGPSIQPGEQFVYDFTVRQTGTFMYHTHVTNGRQQMMGLCGMFVALPLDRDEIDRDFVILLQEWCLTPSDAMASLTPAQQHWAKKNSVKRLHRVEPLANAFNYFTLNGKSFPDTAPLTVKYGERIRIRIGNLSMHAHAMHLHGHVFAVTAMDGNKLTAQSLQSTVNVAPGQTIDIEFEANNPGTWAFHCTQPHRVMNGDQNPGGMMTTLRYASEGDAGLQRRKSWP